MAKKSRQELINTVHNLAVTHEKLECEYWVIRSEGGFETAELLREVCEQITQKIKEIHEELLVREACNE